MEERIRPRLSTPKGLGIEGRRVWKRIANAYLLRPDEVFLLESACRTADIIARLDAAMEGEPLQVKGSMGQMREHPLLSEARQQRGLFSRMLAQLKLPDEDGEVDGRNQHRDAALSRWNRTTS